MCVCVIRRLDVNGPVKMLVKNDVLSEFASVRSCERVDLLCSLLDLCLPFELRFLGTCLEFLAKRDFYELREDERDANNVNHVSSFRSLTEENTRRKLVLYVSLLKSCNTDCANCLNDTLTALCIGDVRRVCRSQPEDGEKVLDELLLLYTIALKHPAFNVHQKTEFAEHLRSLQEEDLKLSRILSSSEDHTIVKPTDSIPETPCKPKDSTSKSIEDLDSPSSQYSVISQANPLTCHVLSGSVYTSAMLPSALHQASATCLNPSHVMVSAVPSPVVQPADAALSPDSASRLNSDTVIAVGLTASPVNSGLMMAPGTGPGPGPGPGPGMVVPLAPGPPSSHCMMPSPGEMGIPKGSLGHPNVMGPMMCVPPEPIPMPYPGPGPGPAHYNVGMMVPVPLVGHLPGPPLGCPPASMAPMLNSPGATPPNKPSTPPVSAPGSTPIPKPAPTSCCSYSHPSPNPTVSASSQYISTTGGPASKENNKYEECDTQGSRSSSPLPKVPTPPAVSKAPQVFNSKGLSHPPLHASQRHHQQPYRGQPNHSPHMPYSIPPNMFPSTQQFPPPLTHISPKLNSSVMNHVPHYPNQIISIGTAPFPPQGPQHVLVKPGGQWHVPGDNLKEVIVREMPKYKANLQDLSPEELLHMGDEQLKDIGLPYNAIQQLRSIVNKLHSTNGTNTLNRNDVLCHNENPGPRRRHFNAPENKAGAHPHYGSHSHGTVGCGYPMQSSYPVNTNNSTSNGHKSGKRQHLQITNQVRALQLEDESKRPASNSSSTSDCSSGSHSPPETPSLPHISEVPPDHFEKGYSGKDSGAESWNSATSEDKSKEERLHDADRLSDDRTRLPYQPPGIQRNSVNSRSRGMSKAPPGIPTIPRGRGHPMAEKNRLDPAVGSMNGVPSDMNNPPPPPYAISGTTGMPSNVPYPPNTPVSSFIPHTSFTTMHAFHRFQSGSFLPAGTAYPFPPNGEMWSPFHQPPQPTPPYLATPIVAFSPAHPPPKLSCYNCGRQGHQGSDCKESTFEEITQQGQYHLDYKPGECRESDK